MQLACAVGFIACFSAVSSVIQTQQPEKNDACKIGLCTDWTEWSDCQMKLNMTTRTRTCGIPASVCPPSFGRNTKTETEWKPCEIAAGCACPMDYTITQHGFCLRYYGPKIQYKLDSVKHSICQKSGGRLVNIDSLAKSKDVKELVRRICLWGQVVLDGRRKDMFSPFKYTYGKANFSDWEPYQPARHGTYLCKHFRFDTFSDRMRWKSGTCNEKVAFVCEYV